MESVHQNGRRFHSISMVNDALQSLYSIIASGPRVYCSNLCTSCIACSSTIARHASNFKVFMNEQSYSDRGKCTEVGL